MYLPFKRNVKGHWGAKCRNSSTTAISVQRRPGTVTWWPYMRTVEFSLLRLHIHHAHCQQNSWLVWLLRKLLFQGKGCQYPWTEYSHLPPSSISDYKLMHLVISLVHQYLYFPSYFSIFLDCIFLCNLKSYLEWGVYINNISDRNVDFLWGVQLPKPDHSWAGDFGPKDLELNLRVVVSRVYGSTNKY